MWRHLPIALGLVVSTGCTVGGLGPDYDPDADPYANLNCTPIDPGSSVIATEPCFRARLSAPNEVTLDWRVVNSTPAVYIADDTDSFHRDIGSQPAFCKTPKGNFCSTTIPVKTGGYYRWQLQAQNSEGHNIHVATSLWVPPPYALRSVTGGGFVDMLAPSANTISWTVDLRNKPLAQALKMGWIEIKHPGEVGYSPHMYPRFGAGAHFEVPAAAVQKPGKASYQLRECFRLTQRGTKFCSPARSVGFFTSSDRFINSSPIYTEGNSGLDVSFSAQSGDVRRLYSSTLLPPQHRSSFIATTSDEYRIDPQFLTPGRHLLELASCDSDTNECTPKERLTVLVDASVQWELGRDYREDFEAGVAFDQLGAGQPLDVTYDIAGGLWQINEFSNSLQHVTPAGEVELLTLPLARVPSRQHTVMKRIQPFANIIGESTTSPSSFSALAERATRVGKQIWFTQGGGMFSQPTLGNHSRVIAFDPDVAQSPATAFDDRLCVYNVPNDNENQMPNNQVVGLTASGGRIWIGESRDFFQLDPSAISAFVPSQESCANLLNLADPQALANQALQYCAAGETPEQNGCMEKFLLDRMPQGIKVAHLESDPVDGSIWFTDARGSYLGNLDPHRQPQPFQIHPLPDEHRELGWFGGFPWSLRADTEAVYVAEYGALQILRFDKESASFDVVDVPASNSQLRLHSIDIDAATDRLWFTLANESSAPLDPSASTIGYIDLRSWREHVTGPRGYGPVSGVIYKGLDSIRASDMNPGSHQAFRGIAIDPPTGKVALATMWRQQITELTPKATFRP